MEKKLGKVNKTREKCCLWHGSGGGAPPPRQLIKNDLSWCLVPTIITDNGRFLQGLFKKSKSALDVPRQIAPAWKELL